MANSALLDVVFFHLQGMRCALPARVVHGMVPIAELTPVPLAPTVLRGVAPVRGQVLPVLDLRVYFPQTGPSARGEKADSSLVEKYLLIETASDANTPAIAAALVVEPHVRVGQIDEQHSRPPPPRPSFVNATVLDGDGPALMINAQQAVDLVRSAISTVNFP